MHAISSYHGNRPTNTHPHPQTGPITIHCAAASTQCNNNNNTRLTAVFQENPGTPVSEFHHSGLHWKKDDGSSADNWSYKTCKAPVKSSPSTIQLPAFYRLDALLPFIQQCQTTEGEKNQIPLTCSTKLSWGFPTLPFTNKGFRLPWRGLQSLSSTL